MAVIRFRTKTSPPQRRYDITHPDTVFVSSLRSDTVGKDLDIAVETIQDVVK